MLVLIADPEPSARAALRAALDRFGYRCQEVADGATAWTHLADGSPDVVLVSADLADVSILELATRLRALKRTPAPYFVALVNADDPEMLLRAMGSGADDFLARPFHDEQLHARIQVAERLLLLTRRLLDQETQLERARYALRASARTDALTNLWNRVQLTDDLELFQGQLQRYGHRYAAMLVNLDRFRAYNEANGQLAGDEVLRLIAQTVSETLRTGDRAYRYAGDEIVVLLPEQTAESACIAAERIRSAIEQLQLPHQGNQPAGVVTVSAGVGAFQAEGTLTYDALLGWTEAALLRAQANGGNRVELSDPATDAAATP
ncbi:MAG: diguanylate cyclase [Chloroflexi bacterium]|nr:diguanylate cyclase [Chloroflexota bacterium]